MRKLSGNHRLHSLREIFKGRLGGPVNPNDSPALGTRTRRNPKQRTRSGQVRHKILSVFLTGIMILSMVSMGVTFVPTTVSATNNDAVQFSSLSLEVTADDNLNIFAEIEAADPDQIDYVFFQIQDADGIADGGDIGGANHNFAIVPHDSDLTDADRQQNEDLVDEDIDAVMEIPEDDSITDFAVEEFGGFPGGQADDIAQIVFRIYTIDEDPDEVLEEVLMEIGDDFEDGEEQTLDQDDDLTTNDVSNEGDVETFGEWITVDQEVEVTGGPFESGAVSIDDGFEGANDALRVRDDGSDYDGFDSESFDYDADTGVLTINPADETASASEFQEVFRDVQYKSDANADERQLTFALTVSGDEGTDAAYFPGTDRWYTWVADAGISWEAARDAAETKDEGDSHLVIIESAAENQFIRDRVGGGGWIGATAIDNHEDQQRDWYWIDEETLGEWDDPADDLRDSEFFHQTAGHVAFTPPFPDPPEGVPGGGDAVGDAYENWNPRHEPRNMFPFFGGQEYAYFCGDDAPMSCHAGMWMDGSVDSPNFNPQGYIVEFHEEPGGDDVEILRAETTVAYDLDDSEPTAEIDVEIDSDPVADDAIEVTPEQEIEFDGSASQADGEVAIDSHQWDITGDGRVDETGQTYSETVGADEDAYLIDLGTYDVSLTVIDENGNTDTATVTVAVVPKENLAVEIEGPYDPETNDAIDPSAVARGQEVQFVSAIQYSPNFEEEITSFHWDFDDGSTSSENAPVHGFQDTGAHTVSVTVETDSETVTDELTVEVQKSDRPEITDFSASSDDQTLDISFMSNAALDEIEVSIYRTDDLPEAMDPSGADGDALEKTLTEGDFGEPDEETGDHTYTATTADLDPNAYTVRLETAKNADGDGAFGQEDTATIVTAPEFQVAVIDDPADTIVVEFDPNVTVPEATDPEDGFSFDEGDITDGAIDDGDVVLTLDEPITADADLTETLTYDKEVGNLVAEADETVEANGFENQDVTNQIAEIEPAFESASISDPADEIEITFDADIEDAGDSTAAFTVAPLDGASAIDVDGLRIEEGKVILELTDEVVADDHYELSYDSTHEDAAIVASDDGSSAQDFTVSTQVDEDNFDNTVDEINPAYASAVIGDPVNEIAVTFDAEVEIADLSTTQDAFTVKIDEELVSVEDVTDEAESSTVTVQLDQDATAATDIALNYAESENALVSEDDGSAAQSFEVTTDVDGDNFDNTVDEISPAFDTAQVVDENPAEVVVTFDNPVTIDAEANPEDDITLTIDNAETPITDVSPGPDADEITVTIDEDIVYNIDVTISYDDENEVLISAEDDSAVQHFAEKAVTNGVEAINPAYDSATIYDPADEITIEFTADVKDDGDSTDAFSLSAIGSAAAIDVEGLRIEDGTVILELSDDIVAGDNYELAYDSGHDNADIASEEDGSPAESFTVSTDDNDDDFDNTVESISPTIEDAVVDEPADVIKLSFTDPVTVDDETAARDDLTVTVDGTELIIDAVEDGPTDTTINVTINETITSDAVVTVSYEDDGESIVSSEDGSPVQDFDNEGVTNEVDDIQPAFESAVIDEPTAEIQVTFDADVKIDEQTDPTTAFTVNVNDDLVGVSDVTDESNSPTVTVKIEQDVLAGDTVWIEYDAEDEPLVSDADGSPAQDFTTSTDDAAFDNNVDPIRPAFDEAGIDDPGETIIVEFDAPVTVDDPDQAQSDITVEIDGESSPIDDISTGAKNDAINITLEDPVVFGDTVSISYVDEHDALISAEDGSGVLSFTNSAVDNDVDPIEPGFSAAQVTMEDPDTLRVTFDADIEVSEGAGDAGFSSTAVAIETFDEIVDDDTVVLVLERDVSVNDDLTITYDETDGNIVSQDDGSAAHGFTEDVTTFDVGDADAIAVEIHPTDPIADGDESVEFTVTVTDEHDNPVADVTVDVTDTDGLEALADTSNDTNADGEATFTATSTDADTFTVTFEEQQQHNDETITVTFEPGDPATVGIDVSEDTVVADGDETIEMTVTVTDKHENPVAGVTIDVTDPDGLDDLVGATTDTNAAGEATFTVTSTDAGVFTVTFEEYQQNNDATVSVTFEAGNATSVTVETQPADSATAGQAITGDGSVGPNVSVTDAYGNPVDGVPVVVDVAQGDGSVTTGSKTTVTTGEDGMATFDSLVIESAADDYQLEFAIDDDHAAVENDDTAQSDSFDITAADAAFLNITADTDSIEAGDSLSITLEVTDEFGNPVADQALDSFTITSEYDAAIFSADPLHVNEDGESTVTISEQQIETADPAHDLTADADGLAADTVSIEVTPAHPADLSVTAAAQTAIANGTDEIVLTATVTDEFGNPIEGVTVETWNDGTDIVIADEDSTAATGEVTFGVTTTTAQDTVDIFVTEQQQHTTATATVSFEAGAADSVNASDTSTLTDESGELVVSVEDEFSNPLEGATIVVTDDGGLDEIDDTAVTNESGYATFTFEEAEAGAYTVQVTVQDNPDQQTTAIVTVDEEPAFESARIDTPANEITVTFTVDVDLDDDYDPADAFTVAINTGEVAIQDISQVADDTITIRLDQNVTAADNVSVEYAADTDAILGDQNDVPAKSFDVSSDDDDTFTNDVEEITPAFQSAVIDEPTDEIAVTFDADVEDAADSTAAFTLEPLDGAAKTDISGIRIENGTVILELTDDIVANDNYALSYDSGHADATLVAATDNSAVQDFTGSSTDDPPTFHNEVDEISPKYDFAEIDDPPNEITVTFDADIGIVEGSIPENAFTIDVNEDPVDVDAVTSNADSPVVTIVIDHNLTAADIASLEYDEAGPLVSEVDNSSASGFTISTEDAGDNFTNSVAAIEPTYDHAVIDEPANEITVTFDAAVEITEGTTPEPAFTITVNDDPVDITTVTAEADSPVITVQIDQTVTDADTIAMAYDDEDESVISEDDSSPAQGFEISTDDEEDSFQNNAGALSAVASSDAFVITVGTEIELQSSDSTAPAHATYTWESAGTTLADDSPSVTTSFDEPGTKVVTLTIRTASDTDQDTIEIAVIDDTDPVAKLNAPDTADVNESITFDAGESTDNVAIDEFEWDFGDGTTDVGAGLTNPTHAYVDPGRYTVTVTVTDTSGNTAMNTTEVLVEGTDGSLSTTSVDFGKVSTSSASTADVVVTNNGTVDLDAHLGVDGDDDVFHSAVSELTVRPGEQRSISITFEPDAVGTYTASITFSDPDDTPLTLGPIDVTGTGVEGNLIPSESVIDFEDTAVDSSATQTISVVNEGDAPLTIDQATIESPAFEVVDGDALPTSLAEDESHSIEIAFTPTTAGPVSGTLVLRDETGAADASVSVTGTGLAADLSIDREEITFSTIGVGDKTVTTVEVVNYGNTDLTIDDIAVVGSSAEQFAIVGAPDDPIGEDDTATFELWFEPAAEGDHDAQLGIESNDPDESEVMVPISGEAVGAEIGIDRRTVNFGNVTVGDTVYMNVTVENRDSSLADLTIEETKIVGSHPDSFDVHQIYDADGTDVEPDFVLEPGETATIQIEFEAPEVVGETRDAQMQILSDASNEPVINVWLSNSRTYIIVQEVSNPTVNIDGNNLVENGTYEVNVWTPTIDEQAIGFDSLGFRSRLPGSFEIDINYDEEPLDPAFDETDEEVPVQYVQLDHIEGDPADTFEQTNVTFQVRKDALPDGATGDDPTLYRYNYTENEWEDVSAGLELVDETATHYVYEPADLPGFSEFALTVPSEEAMSDDAADAAPGDPAAATGGEQDEEADVADEEDDIEDETPEEEDTEQERDEEETDEEVTPDADQDADGPSPADGEVPTGETGDDDMWVEPADLPDLEIVDVHLETQPANSVDATSIVTLENHASESREATVRFVLNGDVIEESDVTVPGEERMNVTHTELVTDPGQHMFEANIATTTEQGELVRTFDFEIGVVEVDEDGQSMWFWLFPVLVVPLVLIALWRRWDDEEEDEMADQKNAAGAPESNPQDIE